MSADLDLRHLHQSYEPDPAFVAALEQRLEAMLVGPSGHARSIKDGAVLDLYLPTTATRRAPRRWVVRVVLGAAAAMVLVAVGVFVRRDDPASVETPIAPIVLPRANGWVAEPLSGIFLMREGENGFLVNYAGSPTLEACPAFSPDGERLMIGGSGIDGEGASLDVVSIAADSTERTRGLDGRLHPPVSLLSTIPLPGVEGIPCAIWAPDGRWAAFGGSGSVWVVDSETGDVRRLAGYDATDLEWRPGTDELAITGQARPGHFVGDDASIDIYTVSTGEVRTIEGVEAAELTWSPDGSTIAYTQQGLGAADTKSGITLIDADGTNQRPLTTDDYVADDGIGVTWSPRGDQIAYQRERADCTGSACFERSEVVLVTVTDEDPDTPIGTERVVPPVVDNFVITGQFDHPPPFNTADWHANSVTWSPDGTELLYYAGSAGLIAVPVDSDRPANVLDGDGLIGQSDDSVTGPWLPLQQWQGLP